MHSAHDPVRAASHREGSKGIKPLEAISFSGISLGGVTIPGLTKPSAFCLAQTNLSQCYLICHFTAFNAFFSIFWVIACGVDETVDKNKMYFHSPGQ